MAWIHACHTEEEILRLHAALTEVYDIPGFPRRTYNCGQPDCWTILLDPLFREDLTAHAPVYWKALQICNDRGLEHNTFEDLVLFFRTGHGIGVFDAEKSPHPQRTSGEREEHVG